MKWLFTHADTSAYLFLNILMLEEYMQGAVQQNSPQRKHMFFLYLAPF